MYPTKKFIKHTLLMLTMLQHNLPNVVYIQYIEKTFIRINPKDKNIKKNALVTSEVVLCI